VTPKQNRQNYRHLTRNLSYKNDKKIQTRYVTETRTHYLLNTDHNSTAGPTYSVTEILKFMFTGRKIEDGSI
jgi:hypothetical protein